MKHQKWDVYGHTKGEREKERKLGELFTGRAMSKNEALEKARVMYYNTVTRVDGC